MRVLVTGAATSVGQVLAQGLQGEHELQLTDRQTVTTELPFTVGDLRDPAFAGRIVQGVDAIVHLPVLPHLADEAERLDEAMRGTYHLLHAAVAAGIARCVLVSSLAVMAGYPADFVVTEEWRPKPSLTDDGLAYYLSELVAREFARATPLEVICLRLGKLVREEAVRDKPFDPLWLDERDAVQAVRTALTASGERRRHRYRWRVFHIAPDHPQARFGNEAAKRSLLQFHPQHNFTATR